MKKLSKNQKGFTAVEGLLIILILVVLGGIGYMVYHNQHKNKVTTAASQTSTTTSFKTASDPYAGWQTCDDTTTGLSFKYPANWTESGQVNNCGTKAGEAGGQNFTLSSPAGSDSRYFYLIYNQCFGGDMQATDTNIVTTSVLASNPLTTSKSLGLYSTYFQTHSPDPETESKAQTVTGLSVYATSQKYQLGQQANSYYEYCNQVGNSGQYYLLSAYLTDSDSQSANPNTDFSIADYQSNSSYKDLVKIFQSITYNK